MKADHTLSDLNHILDAERGALLAGRYDALPEIAERKAALIEGVTARPLKASANDLQTLREKTAHNSALLQAAREGLQLTMDRLSAMRGESGFATYNRQGDSIPQTSRPNLHRRA